MRVALCNVQEFNPLIGGIERVSVSLAEQLIDNNVEVIFISCRKSKYSKEYCLPAPQFILPSSEDYSLENVAHMIKLVREQKIDILINQNAHSYSFHKQCCEVSRQSDVKLISVLHFDPDMRRKGYKNMMCDRFFTIREKIKNGTYSFLLSYPITYISLRDQRKLYRALYYDSDSTVLLSSKYYEIFSKIGGISEHDKLSAIANMLSFPIEKNEYCKSNTILFCGRMAPPKNPYRALYAWRILQKVLPDWNIKFVGDGPWFKRLKLMAEKLGLCRYEFCGMQSPINYYKEAKIFLLTSNYEGFPLVLNEAMQYGCVPVAFESFESITDIISNGENGFLVPPFDINQFADKIKELAMNCCEFDRMSKNARQSTDRFAPEKIIKKWQDLFYKVLR